MLDAWEEFAALTELFSSWVERADQYMDELAVLSDEVVASSRMRKQPRPPRYIGPARKVTAPVYRVARVARSSCRKIRRH